MPRGGSNNEGSGSSLQAIEPETSNLDIAGVTCGPSHGIIFGSLGVHNSQVCVSNLTVRDTIIRESDSGLRINTWQGGMGSMMGLKFENIQMENVGNCVLIDQYYCLSKACLNQTSVVHVNDVPYRNIKGTCDVRTAPIHFAYSCTATCTNITLRLSFCHMIENCWMTLFTGMLMMALRRP